VCSSLTIFPKWSNISCICCLVKFLDKLVIQSSKTCGGLFSGETDLSFLEDRRSLGGDLRNGLLSGPPRLSGDLLCLLSGDLRSLGGDLRLAGEPPLLGGDLRLSGEEPLLAGDLRFLLTGDFAFLFGLLDLELDEYELLRLDEKLL